MTEWQKYNSDLTVVLYGYVRGIAYPLLLSFPHFPGCQDFHIRETLLLPDTIKWKKYNRMAEIQQCDLTVALYGYVRKSPYCPTSFPHARMLRLSHS